MTDHDILRPDRKKSAHWTENDTAILLDVLLRYKDTGRTQDNGFKPEVWKEAAERVKGTTTTGGPKTPEACKSRWQRLQRDFKAIKELETLPGFTFNRTTHKLQATSEAWAAADKTHEALKAHKIVLPQYDALTTLCPIDPSSLCMLVRNKNRTSLGAMSDTSSLLSTMSSAGSVNPQTPQMGLAGMLNTPGLMPQVGMGVGLGDEMINWDAGEMENDQDLEGTFTMPDGSMITMPRAQKRVSTHFDHDAMSGHGHMTVMTDSRSPPSKKPRLNHMNYPQVPHRQSSLPSQNMQYGLQLPPAPTNSPDQSVSAGHGHGQMDNGMGLTSPTHSLASAHLQAVTGLQPSHMASHQHGHPGHHQPNQQTYQHQPPMPQTSHQHPQPDPQHTPNLSDQGTHQHHPSHPTPTNQQFSAGQDRTTQTPHHVPSRPQTQPLPQAPTQHSHFQVQQSHAQPLKSHSPLRYPAPPHPPPGRPTPDLTDHRRSPVIPDNASEGSHKIELIVPRPMHASKAQPLSRTPQPSFASQTSQTSQMSQSASPKGTIGEGQRRMDAIILLQNQETEMKDEEMIEIVAEFEASVAAADTYLAIRRDGLRKLYLDKILKRRAVGGRR